jgi:hypothetical protein
LKQHLKWHPPIPPGEALDQDFDHGQPLSQDHGEDVMEAMRVLIATILYLEALEGKKTSKPAVMDATMENQDTGELETWEITVSRKGTAN